MTRALALAAVLVGACGANTTTLTPAQEAYLRAHPELGPRDRNALLYRTISLGDTLERVKAAWDGALFRRREPATPDVIGGRVAVSKEPIDTYEVYIALGDREVAIRSGDQEERVPNGRLILVFKDERLASYVRME